jgi:hypothetical protein
MGGCASKSAVHPLQETKRGFPNSKYTVPASSPSISTAYKAATVTIKSVPSSTAVTMGALAPTLSAPTEEQKPDISAGGGEAKTEIKASSRAPTTSKLFAENPTPTLDEKEYYFDLEFNTEKRKIALSIQKSYERVRGKLYHTVTFDTEGKVLLKAAWLRKPPTLGEGKIAYVVIKKDTNELELRVGSQHHYILAEKRETNVVAAGDITLEKGIIVKFDDRSGAYHIPPDAKDIELRRKSLWNALRKVGLPVDNHEIFKWHTTSQNLIDTLVS